MTRIPGTTPLNPSPSSSPTTSSAAAGRGSTLARQVATPNNSSPATQATNDVRKTAVIVVPGSSASGDPAAVNSGSSVTSVSAEPNISALPSIATRVAS